MVPVAIVIVLVVALVACEAPTPTVTASEPAIEVPPLPPDTTDVQGVSFARATIEPVGDGGVEGTVSLSRSTGGVRVLMSLTGLSSQDFHAVQVLRGRDCDADPGIHLGIDEGTPHGGPYLSPRFRHAGDLGSIRSDRGRGRYDRIDPVLSLDGTMSAVGRAVVVRELRDDESSPDGAAGDVIGCGVLEGR
ncbi:superoxide dismutase family protein [Rubrivirga sp.]|uniref:superoxide dismutase family protein n=1 Tax=Rubrivirga sp. TaxID=1885344 RepID=UPI003C74A501